MLPLSLLAPVATTVLTRAAISKTQKTAVKLGTRFAISATSGFIGTQIKNKMIQKEAVKIKNERISGKNVSDTAASERLTNKNVYGSAVYGGTTALGAGMIMLANKAIDNL